MSGKKNLCRLFAIACLALIVQSCNLTNFPSSSKEWDKAACEKYQHGDYANASNDWDQAVKLQPDYPDFWWKRSRACMRFGRDQQAIDDARKAIELLGDKDPRKLIYFNLQLAEALANKGEFDVAKETFKKALELSDGKLDAAPIYMERGRVLMLTGNPEGAIVDISKAISLVPTWGRAYFYRGKSYEKAGDPVKAAQDFEKAISMNYDDVGDNWEPLPID